MSSEKTIDIEGVIVFDVDAKKYSFIQYLQEDDFTDGGYKTAYSNYVFIRPYTLVARIPDVDMVKPQLAALDAQEDELTAKYHAAKTEIERQRQNLLAIEHDAGGAQ